MGASPGGAPYNIADGERTIFDQYLLAIGAAKEAIYIENQAIPIPPVADAIEEALTRRHPAPRSCSKRAHSPSSEEQRY